MEHVYHCCRDDVQGGSMTPLSSSSGEEDICNSCFADAKISLLSKYQYFGAGCRDTNKSRVRKSLLAVAHDVAFLPKCNVIQCI